jgi:hypothetical protein
MCLLCVQLPQKSAKSSIFRSDEDVKAMVVQWFQQQLVEFFAEGSIDWYLNAHGDFCTTPSNTIPEWVSFEQTLI